MNDVVLFLQAMGEPEMAERVLAEHNRLEAFSDGLEKDCIDSAFKAGADSRDAEVAELQKAIDDNWITHQQIVAANKETDQLRAHVNRLLGAFQTYIDAHEECEDADGWMAMMCSIEAHHVADEALATAKRLGVE